MSVLKSAFYGILDGVTLKRGVPRVIGGQRIKFPARWSRYYESDYEPETFRFMRSNLRPGEVLFDIGAHIGLFSVVASELLRPGGKVVSFEPTPFTRSVLKEVVHLNGCDDVVEVRGEAVCDKSGTGIFHDTGDDLSNANSLVNIDRTKGTVEVSLVSLDDFVKDRNLTPNYLKIDVEGAELDLLRGAKETFLKLRPVCRLGLHPPQLGANGQNLREIWELLASYDMRVEFEGAEADEDWFCKQTNLFDVNLLPKT